MEIDSCRGYERLDWNFFATKVSWLSLPRRDRFGLIGQIAVQATTDQSRIGVAVTSHHRDHLSGVIEQDLNSLDQSLGARLEQSVQEELANLEGLRNRIVRDQLDQASGGGIVPRASVSGQVPGGLEQAMGITARPLENVLVERQPMYLLQSVSP